MSACRRADGAVGADADGKSRSKNCCTNIAVMQLFHELKQQFPTVPDDVVSACIMDHCHDRPACRQRLQEAAAIAVPRTLPRPTPQQPIGIGKPPISPISIQNKRFPVSRLYESRNAKPDTMMAHQGNQGNQGIQGIQGRVEPPESYSYSNSESCAAVSVTDLSKHFTQQCDVKNKPPIVRPVRPVSLDLSGHPSTSTRLLKNTNSSENVNSVNVSLNVNCSMVGSPTVGTKHSSVLQVTPEPVWCQHMSSAHPGMSGMGDSSPPRSYTSVNLTLRTPTGSDHPQPPIDICSSPASGRSLTYTTSSFDRRQGLESCLQITVGPGGSGLGTVTALRTRPNSTLFQHPSSNQGQTSPVSLPDLLVHRDRESVGVAAAASNHVVLLSKQFQRKEQLKSELEAGRERLNAIKKEVHALQLENSPEYRTRLKKEIRHLQSQCERLTRDVDRQSESGGGVPLGEINADFYRHIYKGQRGSLRPRQQPPQQQQPHVSAVIHPSISVADNDNEPHWQCHLCTFRNHPLMNKCEQCEMPRVLLVSAGPGENIHIRFSPGNTTRVIHSWVV